jgi:hypothetical protein
MVVLAPACLMQSLKGFCGFGPGAQTPLPPLHDWAGVLEPHPK